MAKNTVADWDTTAGNNTDVGGVSLAEGSGGMRVPAVNNALREMMAQIKAGIGVSFQAYSASLTGVAAAWTTASTSGPASLAFAEDTDNGTNKITVTAPSSIASDISLTLPATAGTLMVSASYPTIVSLEGLSLAAGDILYATAADTVQRLAIGTASQVLQVNAGATAPEWTTLSTSPYVLHETLTTTSGTTQVSDDIPACTEILLEIDVLSFTAGVIMTLELSSTNGSSWGSAVNIAGSTGGAATTMSGVIRISNVASTVAAAKVAQSLLRFSSGAVAVTNALPDTDSAARVNAIRLAGGTFDAGTVRVKYLK